MVLIKCWRQCLADGVHIWYYYYWSYSSNYLKTEWLLGSRWAGKTARNARGLLHHLALDCRPHCWTSLGLCFCCLPSWSPDLFPGMQPSRPRPNTRTVMKSFGSSASPHRACPPISKLSEHLSPALWALHSCPSDLAPRVYPSATTLEAVDLDVHSDSQLVRGETLGTYLPPTPVSLQVGAATWQAV